MPTDGPLRILIVGAGRLGATLAMDLAQAGHSVSVVVRRRERAIALSARCRSLTLVASWTAAVGTWDAIVVAVPDRALQDVAHELALQPEVVAAIWLHCSGVAPARSLACPQSLAAVGSLHPLAAIADPVALAAAPSPLIGALMAVAGDPPAIALATRLAHDLRGLPCLVPDAARPAYHAAAALIANDWVALAIAAESQAIQAGLPPGVARAGLLHLAQTALLALRRVPQAAPLVDGLTGAVSRADAGTLQQHLDALCDDANAADLHRLASVRLALACRAAGRLSDAQLAAIMAVLEQAGEVSKH